MSDDDASEPTRTRRKAESTPAPETGGATPAETARRRLARQPALSARSIAR